ncbi:MAG TPA: ACT domain-containing protein [Firmicutes bacterium]|nr:ACT domain-containing protein [Bacillota bacterium]HBK68307.1 ACT domain-containing protein [Bacillota bacterium]HBT17848.1 ACT domain-containing protein [Bacillota bacterium]
MEKAVVTVMGEDKVGIVAGIAKELAVNNCNIIDISQTLRQGIFAMILIIQLPETLALLYLRDRLEEAGERLGVKVVLQHADIFQYMHRL